MSRLENASIGVGSLYMCGKIAADPVFLSWWTWYVEDAIEILITSPFLFCWIGQPREEWKKRRAIVAWPLGLMLGLVVAYFFYTNRLEEDRLRATFRREAQAIADVIGEGGASQSAWRTMHNGRRSPSLTQARRSLRKIFRASSTLFSPPRGVRPQRHPRHGPGALDGHEHHSTS